MDIYIRQAPLQDELVSRLGFHKSIGDRVAPDSLKAVPQGGRKLIL
jgi:hypothetical protein